MKILITFICIGVSFVFSSVKAQFDIIFTPGYGIASTKSKIYSLQDSYSSYITYKKNNVAEGIEVTADPNFDINQFTDFLSFQLAFAGEGVYAGISYMPNKLVQERSVMTSDGFGRKFRWEEYRQEYLLDVGFGSKYIDAFLSFGVNFNKYRMTSYQVYPNGTLSLSNQFYLNGVFKTQDTGISYGFGIKLKPINYLAIDIRYIYANNKLPGEYKTTEITGGELVLSDLNYARPPIMSEFPQDFNAPLTYKNAIAPRFNRSYLTLSLILHFRTNEESN